MTDSHGTNSVGTDFLSTGTLPDHYEQLAKTVRDFAQSVVAPVAAKHDEEHSFPYEVVAGMADMGEMEMPLPDNTLPMMTGFAQFGAVEMGGMFSVVKVREGLASGDYKDPGWYDNPPGTVAWEWKGPTPATTRASSPTPAIKSDKALKVVKPSGHGGHR